MGWTCEILSDVGTDAEFVQVLSELVCVAATREPSAPTGDWSLAIRLTDDASIAVMHAEYFGDLSPTDVISFPSGDVLSATAGYLGDIVISVDTAALNAVDVGHSTQREIAFLALHGFLHLCGHTDASEAERMAMLRRQTEMLEELGAAIGVAL